MRYGAACGSLMSSVKRGLRRLAISATSKAEMAGRKVSCNAGKGNNAGASEAILPSRMNMPNNSNSIECFIASIERVVS